MAIVSFLARKREFALGCACLLALLSVTRLGFADPAPVSEGAERDSTNLPASPVPVSGFDSLATATLGRALDYMQIHPSELGFEKRYVEDDTFRIGLVDALLQDPLRLAEWQAEAVTDIRARIDQTARLLEWAGATIDAAPNTPPIKSPNKVSSRLSETPTDSPAHTTPNMRANTPTSTPANSRPDMASSTIPSGASPRSLDGAVQQFVREAGLAETELERAFARLDDSLRDRVRILAPAMWGEWEHPVDKARKGMIHFELGAAPDTSLELKEDLILDAAALVDRAALTRAAQRFVEALSVFSESVLRSEAALGRSSETGGSVAADDASGAANSAREPVEWPAAFRPLALDIQGSIVGAWDSPWGWIVVGGSGANRYPARVLQEVAVIIDPAGDDVYEGRAASAVGGLLRPLAAVVDGAGNDVYLGGNRSYNLGGALFGVAVLIDRSGDDVYRGDDGVLGAGCFGVGILHDGGGRDLFEGRNLCQGAGAFGIGILHSAAGEEAPPGQELQPDRGYEAGLLPVPGTGAVAVRWDENDTYIAARYAQGFGSTFGLGLLDDEAGNDVYRAGGLYLHIPLLPNDFQSLAQGFSIGFRPRAGGGVGILLDESGNDFYDAEVYAQGTSYWYSVGLLFDGAGNDRYLATQYAQGAGVHLSIGSLWDRGGDDHYVSRFGVTQGTAHDLSVGMLRDESGNDYYAVSDGQGISITNSVAFFVDEQGDDFYATPRGGQGRANYRRGFSGAAVFLDLEGTDQYTGEVLSQDGAVWAADDFAIGIDLDRDVEIPGEVVPEIILSAADSARAVDELFETASLWEVGSAREKVRRARLALIAKGAEAVAYATATGSPATYPEGEPLAAQSTLVYRTLLELAKSSPDSFTARIVPRLRDPEVQVQKNVISLLGELKRTEAREPLEAMLRDPRQDEHWTRILAALGDIGDAVSRPAVRPFLRDGQERRRISALASLRELKDTTAVSLMIPMLDDPLFTVRSAAMATIGSLEAAAVDAVIARLEQERRPLPPSQEAGRERATSPRAALVRILGNIAAALREATEPTELHARGRARAALLAELDPASRSGPGSIGDAAARAAAVSALYRLGQSETRDWIRTRMLDEFDPLVKRTSVWEESRVGRE